MPLTQGRPSQLLRRGFQSSIELSHALCERFDVFLGSLACLRLKCSIHVPQSQIMSTRAFASSIVTNVLLSLALLPSCRISLVPLPQPIASLWIQNPPLQLVLRIELCTELCLLLSEPLMCVRHMYETSDLESVNNASEKTIYIKKKVSQVKSLSHCRTLQNCLLSSTTANRCTGNM